MILRRERFSTSNSFCNLYRPCLPDEIAGQTVTKNIIKNALKKGALPHTLLFAGEPGTGKTTMARIVALGLNCESTEASTDTPCLECPTCLSILNNSNIDVIEINVGKEGGKADIDRIISTLCFAPMTAKCKVLIFDEAHKLTDAAKDLLLKPVEDGNPYVYFIFCTNQPDKLLKPDKKEGTPFADRCSSFIFSNVPAKEIETLLINICDFEGIPYNKDIIHFIATESKGIPRKAITWLEQITIEGSWEKEVASTIVGGVTEEDVAVFNLCKKLLRGDFKESIALYDSIKSSREAEGIRAMLFCFFASCLRNATNASDYRKFSKILDIVQTPVYTTGKLGEATIVHSIYKISDIIQEFRKGSF